MPLPPRDPRAAFSRRHFIKTAGWLALGSWAAGKLPAGDLTGGTVDLPFDNGRRDLVAYPGKRPLICLTRRPPQMETPFAVFNDGLLTPNDAFFVRYHLSDIPTRVDPATYRLRVRGRVAAPLELSLDDLRKLADPVDLIAVNQCSGNSRGFFAPRANGGQLAHGAMGCARWTGVPLRAVLDRAGVTAGARQVTFNGLDRGPLEATPDFVKALDLDHARDGEVMLAWGMNGEDLPMLNGYPLRLVVPGYYGTYWVKHLSDIEVIDGVYEGFWMKSAYRIPDTPDHCIEPGATPKATVPINRLAVRSFITSLQSGASVPARRETVVRGIAFDSGRGLDGVAFSSDGGRNWREARLGPELGRHAFREWTAAFIPEERGPHVLLARATNRAGETQPLVAGWNPAGYMRNVVETVTVEAT